METVAERGYPRGRGLPRGGRRRGLPLRAGFPLGQQAEGGSVNYLLTSLFPLFLPLPEGAHDSL